MFRFSFAFAVLVALGLPGALYAQVQDFEPSGKQDWSDGKLFPLLYVAANNTLQPYFTRVFEVDTGLLPWHCEGFKHAHFEYDYSAFSTKDVDAVAQGNQYWDLVFGATAGLTTRVENCSDASNCHTYALSQWRGKGVYNYSLQDGVGALKAEGYGISNEEAYVNDIISYGQAHSTYICTPTQQEKSQMSSSESYLPALAWKWNSSGVYVYGSFDLDTPAYLDAFSTAVGNEIPTKNWGVAAGNGTVFRIGGS